MYLICQSSRPTKTLSLKCSSLYQKTPIILEKIELKTDMKISDNTTSVKPGLSEQSVSLTAPSRVKISHQF